MACKALVLCSWFLSRYLEKTLVVYNIILAVNDNLGAFTCNVRDIMKVISQLKNSSSPGPDGYSVYFLRRF